jgi:hypothetical protein
MISVFVVPQNPTPFGPLEMSIGSLTNQSP